MDERHPILIELEQARQRAGDLIRAKVKAVSEQLHEAASRAASDLDMVVPPDLDAFLPLSRVDELLDDAERAAEARIVEATRAATENAAPAEAPIPAAAVGTAMLRSLDAGRAQSEILQEMLRQLEPWCSACAITVFKQGRAAGWAGQGLLSSDVVRSWNVEIASSPALDRVASGVPVTLPVTADPVIAGWLQRVGETALLVPMSLRGNIVGALIAATPGDAIDAEPIQVATFVTGLLLETMSVRTAATAALAVPEAIGGAAAPAPSEAAWEPEGEAEVETGGEVEAEPEPAIAAVPEVEPSDEVAAAEAGEAEAEVPEDAAATVQMDVPVAAVTAERSPEDERKHEEARRFSRLLVSEILLYNEQAVNEGRKNRDIYQRLKEDIDRSREMYEQRVSTEVRAGSNYFFDELVRILGDGDPDALGL